MYAQSKDGRCMLVFHPDDVDENCGVNYYIDIQHPNSSSFRKVSLEEGLEQIKTWDKPEK